MPHFFGRRRFYFVLNQKSHCTGSKVRDYPLISGDFVTGMTAINLMKAHLPFVKLSDGLFITLSTGCVALSATHPVDS
jgi:hypothetical protein